MAYPKTIKATNERMDALVVGLTARLDAGDARVTAIEQQMASCLVEFDARFTRLEQAVARFYTFPSGGSAPNPATNLGIQTQPSSTASSGLALTTQPVILVRDALNATVLTATDTVTAAIATGTGDLTGTVTVNAVNGVATFTNLIITGSGAYTLVFTAVGLTSATSDTITVSGGAATKLGIATQPMGAVTTVAFTTQPIIEVRDSNSVLVSSSTVAIVASLATGSGSLSGTLTKNAVNGVATFTNLVYTGVSPATIIFTSTGLTSVTSTDVFAVDPVPSGTMILDTRSGGAQTWQDGSITTITQMVTRLKANGSLITSVYAGDPDPDECTFVNNFDGAGTSVFRSSMPAAVNADGGGGRLHMGVAEGTLVGGLPLDHVYFQFKLWMGRTAAGGGGGSNGVFTIHNTADSAHNAGRKLHLTTRDKPGDPGGSGGRLDFDWSGRYDTSPPHTASDVEGFYAQPLGSASYYFSNQTFQPEDHIGEWITWTYEVQNSTTENGLDGYVKVWVNGVEVAGAACQNINVSNYPIRGWQLCNTFRSPKQDQTEYYKDIVIWVP